MTSTLNFPIKGHGPIARKALQHGFTDFLSLAEHVRQLPYRRPVDKHDILAVLTEQQGTCSSKHRLLAAVAHECSHTEIELVVGIYEMSESNTPGVGAVLKPAGLDSIPEAHCYLRFHDQRYDFTGLSNGSSSPLDSLLSEHVVTPDDLPHEKAPLHHDAISAWAELHGSVFADAWSIREACIEALTTKF